MKQYNKEGINKAYRHGQEEQTIRVLGSLLNTAIWVYRRFRVYTSRFLRNADILMADYATSHPRRLQALCSSHRSQEPQYHESSLSASDISPNGQPTAGKVTHWLPPPQNTRHVQTYFEADCCFLYLLAIAWLARLAITQNMSMFTGSIDWATAVMEAIPLCLLPSHAHSVSHTTQVYFN